MKTFIGALVATASVALATPAFAEDAWGTADDAATCATAFDSKSPNFINGSYVTYDHGRAVRSTKATPECQAELEKRGAVCLADPATVKLLEEARTGTPNWRTKILKEDPTNGPMTICLDDVFQRVKRQHERAIQVKAEKAARDAEAAKVELPTAEKRDKKLEKQIAAAYKAEYPDNTVLMVLLQSKGWDTERSDYGVVTNRNIQAIVVNKQPDGSCQLHNEMWMQEYIGGRFKGPLSQRGAGSQRLTPILCEKVPGADKPAKPAKRTK
jgi:hypothetical protein